MDVIQAVGLGLVQGLTEFLPISSTAHLALVPWFVGWKDPGLTFDVALHVGTLVAVTAYFREDLWGMLRAGFTSLVRRDPSDPFQRLAWQVVIGCIPAIFAGVLLDQYVSGALRSPAVIASALIVVGLLLALADRQAKEGHTLEAFTWKSALLVGLAQACALVPGVSRSGATMAAALGLGFERPAAARFSFLLGYPVILGGCVFKLKDLIHAPDLAAMATPIAIGVAASAVSGYFCIAYLLRFLQSNSFKIFVGYRLALGLAIFVMLALGVTPPDAPAD